MRTKRERKKQFINYQLAGLLSVHDPREQCWTLSSGRYVNYLTLWLTSALKRLFILIDAVSKLFRSLAYSKSKDEKYYIWVKLNKTNHNEQNVLALFTFTPWNTYYCSFVYCFVFCLLFFCHEQHFTKLNKISHTYFYILITLQSDARSTCISSTVIVMAGFLSAKLHTLLSTLTFVFQK